jgi:hypothetical protein
MFTFMNDAKHIHSINSRDFYNLDFFLNVNFSNKNVLSHQLSVQENEWPHIFNLSIHCTLDDNVKDFQYKVR